MSTKFYPRSTIKRITRAHTNKPLTKNVDILIYLDYMLFMQKFVPSTHPERTENLQKGSLIREATIHARQRGERGIGGRAVRKVREGCLRKFRG